MTAILHGKDSVKAPTLYMAMELSNEKWKLGFSNGEKNRQVSIDVG